MNKNIIVATIIVVVLAVGVVWYFTRTESDRLPPLVTDQIKNQQISVFTLTGKVVKIEGSALTLATGSVQDTAEGRQYVQTEKTVTLIPGAELYLRNLNNKATVKDIKVGSQVTVYTNQNPYVQADILIYKLLVQY